MRETSHQSLRLTYVDGVEEKVTQEVWELLQDGHGRSDVDELLTGGAHGSERLIHQMRHMGFDPSEYVSENDDYR